MNAEQAAEGDVVRTSLLESQLRRIDRLWTKFEATGEERWMAAALAADRVYLRMRGAA